MPPVGPSTLRSRLPFPFLYVSLTKLRQSFGAAIRINGSAWANSKEPKHVIAIVRAIEVADPDGGNMDELQAKKFLGTLDM